MLSLCSRYWQIMLVHGVLMGICQGFLQLPAMAAVSQYFDKNRAAALGAVVSGSSIGGIVLPIALSKMLNDSTMGFGWSVRVIGFVMLPLIGIATFTLTPRLPPRTTSFFALDAFKNKLFLALISAFFFGLIGMFTPLFFLPTYAVSRGMSSALAGYLLAILNAASTFGRIIPGVLADKFGRINAFAAGGISSGIVIFFFNMPTSTAGLIVYALIFGFTSGAIFSGGSAAVSLCVKDPRDFGTYLGMGLALAAVGGLIGPPVDGALVDKYGGFFELSMFGGALCLFGGIIALFSKILTPQGLFGKV